MNNNDGVFLKLLLPAIFLILWALSQLFNKESQAANTNRPGGALGPRPGGLPPAPRPTPVQQQSAPARPYRGGAPGTDEDIMIIRSETARPGATPARPRPARGKPTAADRAGAARAAGGRAPRRETRPETRPVTSEAPKVVSAAAQAAGAPEKPLLIGVSAPLSAESIRQMMSSRDRIREAIIINEILQPPVTLRGVRGRRP